MTRGDRARHLAQLARPHTIEEGCARCVHFWIGAKPVGMTNADPTRTVHFVLARALARRMGSDTPSAPDLLGYDSTLEWSIMSPGRPPEERVDYADTVLAAWFMLAFACGVAMVAFGFLARVLFGAGVADIVLTVWFGVASFCMAGGLNAFWRKHYAKRAARSVVGSKGYRKSWDRSLPRNSSLVFQAFVGIGVALYVGNGGQIPGAS
jgi:hypothetical protein